METQFFVPDAGDTSRIVNSVQLIRSQSFRYIGARRFGWVSSPDMLAGHGECDYALLNDTRKIMMAHDRRSCKRTAPK